METDIATSVIQDYQRVRNIIKTARLEYLKEVGERSRQVVKKNEEILSQQQRTQAGLLEHQKLRHEVLARLETYERHQHLEKTLPQGESSEGQTTIDDKIAAIAKKFVEPSRNSSRHRRTRTSQFFNRTHKDNLINTKLSKRMHHPSSKILLVSETRAHDFIGLSAGLIEPKLLKRQNENPEDFKLNINSSVILRNPEYFKKFYGGGPLKYDFESGSVFVVLFGDRLYHDLGLLRDRYSKV